MQKKLVKNVPTLEQLCIRIIAEEWEEVLTTHNISVSKPLECANVATKCVKDEVETFNPFQCLPEAVLQQLIKSVTDMRRARDSNWQRVVFNGTVIASPTTLVDFLLLACRSLSQLNLPRFAWAGVSYKGLEKVLTRITEIGAAMKDLTLSDEFVNVVRSGQLEFTKHGVKEKRDHEVAPITATNVATSSVCPVNGLRSAKLECLFRSVPMLARLCLSGSIHLKNWMVGTIADCCPQLRELDLTGCVKVTDVGVLCFCTPIASSLPLTVFGTSDSPAPIHSRILQRLFLVGTSISVTCVMALMTNLPYLRLFHHPHLLPALQRLSVRGTEGEMAEQPIAAKLPRMDFSMLLSSVVCDKSWMSQVQHWNGNALNPMDQITVLTLVGLTADIDFNFLASLPNLKDLTLSASSSGFSELKARRRRRTTGDVDSFDSMFRHSPYEGSNNCGIDLRILASSCGRKLKRLILCVGGPVKFRFPSRRVPEEAFLALEDFEIDCAGSQSLPTADALAFLARCVCLRRLVLHASPWLTDKSLEDLLRQNPLTRIRYLELYGSTLSSDGIRKLLDSLELRHLAVCSNLVGSHQRKSFISYSKRRNPGLNFQFLVPRSSHWFMDLCP